MPSYQLSDYSDYLSAHSFLHVCARNAYLCNPKFGRLPKHTDIAILQSQIDELRNVVCRKQAATT